MGKKNFSNVGRDILGVKDLFEDSQNSNSVVQVDINIIKDNPYQPRKIFDQEKLQELADSIKTHGVIQPIVVKKENDNIVLVAGERRLRASKLIGMKTVPAIFTEGNALEISLIENLQRENLDPFEEAEALQIMIEKYNYTQDTLAQVVGKSRPSITKSLSLNKIPDIVKEKCSRVNIPKRTLFEIAQQKSTESMSKLVDKIIAFDLKLEDIILEKNKEKAVKQKQKISTEELLVKKIKEVKSLLDEIEIDKFKESSNQSITDEITLLIKNLENLLK